MSDAALFWGILVGVMLLLIIYGMISSAVNQRRARRQLKERINELPFKLESEKLYNLMLSSGRRYERVKIPGVTEGISSLGHYVSLLGDRWLVLELSKKRIYIKENRVSIIEES